MSVASPHPTGLVGAPTPRASRLYRFLLWLARGVVRLLGWQLTGARRPMRWLTHAFR